MGIRIPKTLMNFNAFSEGGSYAGLATAVQLPNVSVKAEEHRAGGMDLPRDIDMGIEKLEAMFTISQMDTTLMKQVSKHNGSNTEWKFYGALNDDESTAAVQAAVTVVGKVTKVEHSEWKSGEKTEDKFTMSCKYYELVVDGELIYKIDNDNLIRIVGGEDQLSGIRGAINM